MCLEASAITPVLILQIHAELWYTKQLSNDLTILPNTFQSNNSYYYYYFKQHNHNNSSRFAMVFPVQERPQII